MALVTKIIRPTADYHQLTQADLSDGDILDVQGSLGNKAATTVTIEALTGDTTIRFNVVEKIYKNHSQDFNSWITTSQSSAVLMGEIVAVKDNIVVTAGSTQSWTCCEMPIRDIHCITLGAAFRLTIT